MVMDVTTVAGGVEILASKDFQAIPVKVAVATDAESTIVKAGTPIATTGMSTTGASAVGILLYDVDTALNPNGAAVVEGIIDATKAQTHSGVTYSTDLYSALPGVVFRTNIGVNS
jgi:hypothetical protein